MTFEKLVELLKHKTYNTDTNYPVKKYTEDDLRGAWLAGYDQSGAHVMEIIDD